MQPGDIVESVDMEMSDDETDNKPKGRVLVDLRSQDRDMRIGGPPSSHLDMDMRMIPLPTGQMPGSRGQLQDMHLMHSGPPPPPPPPFHQGQSNFRQEQPDFHCNQSVNFHPNQPNFHQNRPPPNFLSNQQDFHPNQQDFHQLHQPQQDFHQPQQDFEYRDREHNIRSKQDFLTESPGRGRYSQSVDHRESLSFHRNDRNNRGGRGFSRNRRDRYSDDHNSKQRNSANNRKSRLQDQHRQLSPETLNSRSSLLQPPDTVMILDDEGMPIAMPEFEQDSVASNMLDSKRTEPDEKCQNSMFPGRRTSRDMLIGSNLASDHEQALSSAGSDDQEQINQATVISVTTGANDGQHNQYVPISEYEEHVESDSGPMGKTNIDDNELVEGHESHFAENEQLELEGSTIATNDEQKKLSANGSFDEQGQEDENSSRKRTLLPNGPSLSGESGPNGSSPHGSSTELHPAIMYEYDGHLLSPNFRPRLGAPVPFPPWRGGPPRGRGFRGGPRGPWLDRGPRGPTGGNFLPRGLKRGGQFRGGGFRGRGRGGNW